MANLGRGLEDDIEICGEAGTATEGLRRIEATRPDVALVDLMLPDGDGLDVCRGVKERVPSVACLILTSYSNDDVLLSAIRADASGFLLKRTAGPRPRSSSPTCSPIVNGGVS